MTHTILPSGQGMDSGSNIYIRIIYFPNYQGDHITLYSTQGDGMALPSEAGIRSQVKAIDTNCHLAFSLSTHTTQQGRTARKSKLEKRHLAVSHLKASRERPLVAFGGKKKTAGFIQ